WSWLKWLPHVDIPGAVDGVGPARYLTANPDELIAKIGPVLAERPLFDGADPVALGLRHLLIVVDDPGYDLSASVLSAGLAGVTVIQISDAQPRREQQPDPEKPVVQIADGRIERWGAKGYHPAFKKPDALSTDEPPHPARLLTRWDSNPTHAG